MFWQHLPRISSLSTIIISTGLSKLSVYIVVPLKQLLRNPLVSSPPLILLFTSHIESGLAYADFWHWCVTLRLGHKGTVMPALVSLIAGLFWHSHHAGSCTSNPVVTMGIQRWCRPLLASPCSHKGKPTWEVDPPTPVTWEHWFVVLFIQAEIEQSRMNCQMFYSLLILQFRR